MSFLFQAFLEKSAADDDQRVAEVHPVHPIVLLNVRDVSADESLQPPAVHRRRRRCRRRRRRCQCGTGSRQRIKLV